MKLLIEKIDPKAKVPVKATKEAVGFDVYAHSIKKVFIHGGANGEMELTGDKISRRLIDGELSLGYLERALIGTGIKATVGPGYEIQVRPRSGLALKQGLTVLNTPGTIDSDYRDEVGVIIVNLSRAEQKIKNGDRIAQLVVKQVEDQINVEVVDKLPDTDSNRAGGFGSSGTSEIKNEDNPST